MFEDPNGLFHCTKHGPCPAPKARKAKTTQPTTHGESREE
jgi:hypothetical protein